MYNNNLHVLNFSSEDQLAIDEIVTFSLEYYTEIFLSKKPIYPLNSTSLKKLVDNFANELFKYGINLILGGLMPEA